jgi:hypothetical protein
VALALIWERTGARICMFWEAAFAGKLASAQTIPMIRVDLMAYGFRGAAFGRCSLLSEVHPGDLRVAALIDGILRTHRRDSYSVACPGAGSGVDGRVISRVLLRKVK